MFSCGEEGWFCESERRWLCPGQHPGQSPDVQVDALVNADAIKVFMEHAPGATQAKDAILGSGKMK